MALRDFIFERRAVQVGARRFSVGKPTVATVYTALGLFGPEIAACVRAAASGMPQDPVEAFLPLFVRPGDKRVAEVLETCVELPGSRPGEMRDLILREPDVASVIARALLGNCDLRRIVGAFDFTRSAEEIEWGRGVENVAVEDDELALVLIARKFSVSPVEVTGWPFEAYLALAEILPKIDQSQDELLPKQWLMPGMDLPGVVMTVVGG